jgi:hypothetical protein
LKRKKKESRRHHTKKEGRQTIGKMRARKMRTWSLRMSVTTPVTQIILPTFMTTMRSL